MAVLLFDDFSGALVEGGGNLGDLGGPTWHTVTPDPPYPDVPFNSGGLLHLPPTTYSNFNGGRTEAIGYRVYPLRCTAYTVEIDDYPIADIMANDFMFSNPLVVAGGTQNQNVFRWTLDYAPSGGIEPEFNEPYTGYSEVPYLRSIGNVGYPPFADYTEKGWPGPVEVVDYDPVAHKFLRIREECGVIYWEYSADGIAWTEHHTYALHPQFDYGPNTSVTPQLHYGLTISKRMGYSGLGGIGYTPYYVTFNSVRIETDDDCPCPGSTGWRVGRVGAGSTPW